MKINAILSGVVAALALGALDASAQFNYQNGDMLAAFGNGGGYDVVVDLGPISSFTTTANYSWNLSSVINSTFGGVSSGVYWSVFGVNIGGAAVNGQTDPYTIWATLPRANPLVPTHAPNIFGGSANYLTPAVGYIQPIGLNTSPGLAGPGLIQNYLPGQELVSTSLGLYTGVMTGPYNGNFAGTWYYNALNSGAGVSDLYLNNPGVHPSTLLGSFSLSGSGQLNYVPEPSTWAMLGSGVLALLVLHRRNHRRNKTN